MGELCHLLLGLARRVQSLLSENGQSSARQKIIPVTPLQGACQEQIILSAHAAVVSCTILVKMRLITSFCRVLYR